MEIRPIRADESENLAPLHRQIQMIHGNEIPKAAGEPMRLNH